MLLVGCSKASTSSSTSTATSSSVTTSSTSATSQTLTIGIIEGAQGDLAEWGGTMQADAHWQCDTVNAQGGLLVGGQRYKFNVIFYENGHMADQSVVAIQKAIQQDHCNFIFEGGTPPDAAMAPYVNAAHLIMIGDSFDPSLYGKYPHLFDCLDSPALLAPSFWKEIAKDQPNWKTFARISIDTNYDKLADQADQTGMAANGMKFLGESMVELNSNDFSAAATKVIGMKPDCIDVGDISEVSGQVIRAIREAGWKGGICSSTTSDASTDQIKALQGEESYIDNFYQGEIGWYPTPPEMQQFMDSFTKATGQAYSIDVHRNWWQCAVLFAGLQAAGTVTDPDAISAAIEKLQIKCPYAPGNPVCTFCGAQSFGRNSQLTVPFGITHWVNQNGTETPVTVGTGTCYAP